MMILKCFAVEAIAVAAAFGSDFDIADYGARTDATAAANRVAIQRAVDACAAAGGGRVVVPAGEFRTGTVRLRSGVNLHLSKGSVLRASTDKRDYNANGAYPQNAFSWAEEWSGGHVLYCVGEHDVAITGEGMIDGSGPAFFDGVDANHWPWNKYGVMLHPTDRDWFRPGQQIAIIETRNVRLEDFTITNAACWTCIVLGCENVLVKNYKAHADMRVVNTDGLSIDCTRNVLVTGCDIWSGDDGIAVRANVCRLSRPQPTENVVVSNCTIRSVCNGIRFGVGAGDIRNVLVTDCRFLEACSGLGYTPAWVAEEKNVFLEDICVRNCRFDNCYLSVDVRKPSRGTSRFDRLTVENCRFRTVTKAQNRDRDGNELVKLVGCVEDVISEAEFGGVGPDYEPHEFRPVRTAADFRAYFARGLRWRDTNFTGEPARPDELPLEANGAWRFVAEGDAAALQASVRVLRDFLDTRFWLHPSPAATNRFVVAVDPAQEPGTARVSVSPGEVRLSGADPAAAHDAVVRLQDELGARDFPALTPGVRVYRTAKAELPNGTGFRASDAKAMPFVPPLLGEIFRAGTTEGFTAADCQARLRALARRTVGPQRADELLAVFADWERARALADPAAARQAWSAGLEKLRALIAGGSKRHLLWWDECQMLLAVGEWGQRVRDH